MVRDNHRFSPKQFRIIASTKVIDLFLEEESESLERLIKFINKPILLQADAHYSQEQYDIIPLP